MRFSKYLDSLCFLIILAILTGCKPSVNPNQGFTISGYDRVVNARGDIGVPLPIVGAVVGGDYIPDQFNPPGSKEHYNQFLDELGKTYVSDARAPGYWNNFITIPYFCGNLNEIAYVPPSLFSYEVPHDYIANLSTFEWDCVHQNTPQASSHFAIAGNIPASITLSGLANFSTQYGAPQMYVYDGSLNLIAKVDASSVNGGGATATFALPPSLSSNSYGISLTNLNSDGTPSPAGFNVLSIAQSLSFSGNPYGVAIASETNYVSERDTCNNISNQYSYSSTFPVISLYSTNQISVGQYLISVGATPTAVAVYGDEYTTQSYSDECSDNRYRYGGSSTALVANSGSNTVSIVDILNDVLLSTVQVGNQPVALVVSPDGQKAFVANYTDNTVSRIDLASQAVNATIAVPGKPTSLTVASDGTLWVGGVGFLASLDPSQMTVTASQSTNKTIVGIAYSDLLSQIITTSSDTNGAVYSEQIAASSVTGGGAYATVASAQISNMPVRINAQSGASSYAYTGTLVNSSVPVSALQGGAPPSVIDGAWVVSATPTGFAISDITGNGVLINEQTSSPIAAVAIDKALSIAYLTMPDSNVVLAVPLPGVSH